MAFPLLGRMAIGCDPPGMTFVRADEAEGGRRF